MTATRGRTATPHHAAHGKPRSGWSWRRRILVTGLTSLILLGFMAWLVQSSFLAVTSVTARPGPHTPAAAIVAAAHVEGHPAIVLVDTGEIARRVDALPWVASTSVSRHWPHGLVITVVERRPAAVAVTSVHGNGVKVDNTGRVLGPAVGHTHLPRLVIAHVPTRPGARLSGDTLGAFSVLATLPIAFKDQVRGVAVVDGSIELLLPGPVTFVLGDTANLRAKYVAVASMIEKEQFTAGDTVDVTVPDAVVVTHAH